ncbi:MAG: MutS-related protein [Eubacteriales bacterium]
MKFSLLYKTPSENNIYEPHDKNDILYDLSIDRSVCAICSDRRRTDFFLSVMRKPLVSANDIIYRQRLLGDFIEHRELFDELKLIFMRYDKIKSDWVELRSSVYPTGSGSNSEALLDYTFSSLKVTAIFPRTIISFFEAIYDALNKFAVKSEALSEMRTFCRDMINNNSLNEIANISSLFQYHMPEDYDFAVLCGLDTTLRLTECDLSDISEKKKKNSTLKKLFDFKKKNGIPDVPGEVGTEKEAVDNARFILTEALYHIDATLTAVTNNVYEIFYGLSRELMFYEVALLYAEYITELGIPLCVPGIRPCEDDMFNAHGLRDLLLAAQGKNGAEIIPNDVDFNADDRGVLIRGINNTGKTTYLRSIGTAQLFAQAGLPVCADSAVISIRSAVFTHFSSAEEDFIEGDTSGRFEGEVKEIARIMNTLRPYSLVLLNETFQTTAYPEGSVGIYNIISAFGRIKTKYIFVTHLLKLFDMCAGSGVRLMETGKGLIPTENEKEKYVVNKIES